MTPAPAATPAATPAWIPASDDHLGRVKAYCDTLESRQEARALLDLAVQTGMGPDALEKIRQRVLLEGVSWGWVSASLAEIIYAEIELQKMIDESRQHMIAQQQELLDDYQRQLLDRQQAVIGESLSRQGDVLKRMQLLVHSLGPKEKIAHEFVRSILDQIIVTTHETWSEKANAQAESVIAQFTKTSREVLEQVDASLSDYESRAQSIAFAIGDRVEAVMKDRLEAFDAGQARAVASYKTQLATTSQQVKITLDEFKSIRIRTQWMSMLKGPVSTFIVILLANAASLVTYSIAVHH